MGLRVRPLNHVGSRSSNSIEAPDFAVYFRVLERAPAANRSSPYAASSEGTSCPLSIRAACGISCRCTAEHSCAITVPFRRWFTRTQISGCLLSPAALCTITVQTVPSRLRYQSSVTSSEVTSTWILESLSGIIAFLSFEAGGPYLSSNGNLTFARKSAPYACLRESTR